jgi:hypothetical protein
VRADPFLVSLERDYYHVVDLELVGGRWDGLTLWVPQGAGGHPEELTYMGVRYQRSAAWHNRYEAVPV